MYLPCKRIWIASLLAILLYSACTPDYVYKIVPISRFGKNVVQLPGAQRIPPNIMELYTVDSFLTDAECSRLIDIIEKHLSPSRIMGQSTEPDKYRNQTIRTSHTAYLGGLTDADEASFTDAIAQKIHRAIGIPTSHAEDLQGQYYLPGQEYKQHLDTFGATHQCKRGERTWTVMIYLNDVEEGGGTYFSELDVKITPRRGKAVIWNNLYEDGERNLATRHSGQPVISGKKVIITQWFRERTLTGQNEL